MADRNLELGVIGNCAIAALVNPSGSIVWSCFPRLDGDPMFCALLTQGAGSDDGAFTIELKDDIPDELRGMIGDRVFGCDICQAVIRDACCAQKLFKGLLMLRENFGQEAPRRFGKEDAALSLCIGNGVNAAEVVFAHGRAQPPGDTHLRQRDGQSAFAQVVARPHESGGDGGVHGGAILSIADASLSVALAPTSPPWRTARRDAGSIAIAAWRRMPGSAPDGESCVHANAVRSNAQRFWSWTLRGCLPPKISMRFPVASNTALAASRLPGASSIDRLVHAGLVPSESVQTSE